MKLGTRPTSDTDHQKSAPIDPGNLEVGQQRQLDAVGDGVGEALFEGFDVVETAQPTGGGHGGLARLLRYRVRSTSWRERLRLGAESFFFEEGTVELYQGAECGELKVDRHGEAVLVGLRDAKRRPLGKRLH